MTAQTAPATDPRRLALNTMAAAAVDSLSSAWSSWADKPQFKPVRGPETGLVMVRGRAGGGGAPFNLGEASVSRATVRLETGEIGHGYCLGRDLDKARLIAVFDALFQRDYNVLLGVFLLSALMVVFFNMLTDIAARLADPRIGGRA